MKYVYLVCERYFTQPNIFGSLGGLAYYSSLKKAKDDFDYRIERYLNNDSCKLIHEEKHDGNCLTIVKVFEIANGTNKHWIEYRLEKHEVR